MKKIPVHEICLVASDGGYTRTDQDVLESLERILRSLHLYGTEFAYVAFNPKLKDTVLQSGTPHIHSRHPNSISCCVVDSPRAFEKKGVRHDDEYDLVHYLDVTSNYYDEKETFAVYDKSKLVERSESSFPECTFRDPNKKRESLLAVIEVDWKDNHALNPF